jgi:sigma-E factor negative regulatory protein RseA
MTDTSHEQLSALMDGELPRDELRFLLRRLDGDATLVQRWSRYHVVSAVFRHQPVTAISADRFAAAVMLRLENGTASVRAPVTGRLLRWAGGGAIAASVAVMALVATRPAGDTTVTAPAAGVTVSSVQGQSAPTATAVVGELHQPLSPQQALPAIGFADYAQPASFESIVPNYVPRYVATQPATTAAANGFVPYVLVVGARPAAEPQPVPAQEGSSKQ